MWLAGRTAAGEYSIHKQSGEYNYKRFINIIPYSLDMIEMRKVYVRVYHNRRFTWWNNNKEYTTHVVNVTFKYSAKEFNKISANLYLRIGYGYGDIDLRDNVCVRNGELIAIRVGTDVECPIDQNLLGKYFYYADGCYWPGTIPTVKSRADLRYDLYENGFVMDGVRFVRYKRSSGSARVGKCLFIDERLYASMHIWDKAGLPIYANNKIDIAAFESYISLTSSSIIDTLEIQPENILLIDDFESSFPENAMATYLGEDNVPVTKHKEVTVTNSIWDGQSLLDTAMFGKYERYGFILLRNRFFKSAAFHCNIQQFFADNGITEVSQLNGMTRAKDIRDIKLITTPSSVKYLKFGSFDKWLDNLLPTFGIVKHEKPTHFFKGRMVQTHYQLINTLQLSLDEVRDLLTPSLDYLNLIRGNVAAFRYHIKYNQPWSVAAEETIATRNDIVYKLLGLNDDFAHTMMYFNFRKACLESFVKDMRAGRILVNGTYCTLCGNPMEMLYAAIGKFDGTSQIGVGNVYNTRFADGCELLGSRSPHVTMGNVWLTRNKYNEEISSYFKCTNEIIYVNSIGENLLERLSGADFDSDSALITDNEILIRAAKRNYANFAVPTRLIGAVKGKWAYCPTELASLDIRTSVNKIGEIINLSQELNTRLWDMVNKGVDPASDEVQDLYADIAYLDVLSNMEIDRAKKILPVDNALELTKLKKKHKLKDDDGKNIKPNFFKPVSRAKGYYNPERNAYVKHKTSMDYVQTVLNGKSWRRNTRGEIMPLYDVFLPSGKKPSNKQRGQAQRIFAKAAECRLRMQDAWGDTTRDLSWQERTMLYNIAKNEFVEFLGKVDVSPEALRYLFRKMDREAKSSTHALIFYSMFATGNQSFYGAMRQKKAPITSLRKCPDGDIDIFGEKYKVVSNEI